MNRALVFGMGVLGVAIAAVPAVALAQGFPPPPPSTYYGNAPTGIVAGQGVVAIVINGSQSTACGAGATLTDSGKVVYVVDVVADAQTTGCGKAGATVMFYFTPTGTTGGRISLDTPAGWAGPGPVKVDINTVSAPLARRGSAPQVSRDGSY
jgi:hypothetical protein